MSFKSTSAWTAARLVRELLMGVAVSLSGPMLGTLKILMIQKRAILLFS